ncbi:MAG: hypothetical protein Q8P41_09180 [Pseudomonadota bacterium]|nr:hypothetical protein [Pseudomonadota bacterium]
MFALLASLALAAPLNPWGSATAPGAALVNPFVYIYPEAVNPILYGSAGLTKGVDIYFGYGQLIPTSGPGAASLEAFPRFFVTDSVALVPHLYWTPGVDGVVIAPEVHVNVSAGRFALVANVGWRPVISTSGFSAGTVPLIVAPEVKLTERFSGYVEVDPTFSLVGDPVGMLIVPGFGMTLDPDARHGLSAGIQIPVLPATGAASFGLWYCFTFPVEEGA